MAARSVSARMPTPNTASAPRLPASGTFRRKAGERGEGRAWASSWRRPSGNVLGTPAGWFGCAVLPLGGRVSGFFLVQERAETLYRIRCCACSCRPQLPSPSSPPGPSLSQHLRSPDFVRPLCRRLLLLIVHLLVRGLLWALGPLGARGGVWPREVGAYQLRPSGAPLRLGAPWGAYGGACVARHAGWAPLVSWDLGDQRASPTLPREGLRHTPPLRTSTPLSTHGRLALDAGARAHPTRPQRCKHSLNPPPLPAAQAARRARGSTQFRLGFRVQGVGGRAASHEPNNPPS
jgi:hypothetical protein